MDYFDGSRHPKLYSIVFCNITSKVYSSSVVGASVRVVVDVSLLLKLGASERSSHF